MSPWSYRDGNVYDKFLAPKWLQGCMPPCECRWHINRPREKMKGGRRFFERMIHKIQICIAFLYNDVGSGFHSTRFHRSKKKTIYVVSVCRMHAGGAELRDCWSKCIVLFIAKIFFTVCQIHYWSSCSVYRMHMAGWSWSAPHVTI